MEPTHGLFLVRELLDGASKHHFWKREGFGFVLNFLLPVSVDIEHVFVWIIVAPVTRAMSHE